MPVTDNNLPPRSLNPTYAPSLTWGGYNWGDFSSAASLPNVSDDGDNVQAGDLATVSGQLYICRTPTSGSAVWDPQTALTHPSRLFNFPVTNGAGALTAIGTSVNAAAATTLLYSEIFVPFPMTVTNINVLQGTAVGTDKMRALLFDEDGAFLVGTAVAGKDTAGADTFLQIALTAATLLPPGRYYVGVKMDGTTDELQCLSAGSPMLITEEETGHTFAGNDDITSVATTFTADVGPIVFLD